MSDLNDLTVAELKELAAKEEVDLTGKTVKADIVAALEEVGIESTDDVLPAGDAEGADAPAEAEPEGADAESDEDAYRVKAKPDLDDAARAALHARAHKQRKNPKFRRQEWFRYKKLGGRHAPWRSPRGMHSKMRMNLKYRPNMVRIGYRTPAAARGLHASGFQEVLVYRPADLEDLDPKIQAARIGGTVGGRKAAAIQNRADEMGIRILNRRDL